MPPEINSRQHAVARESFIELIHHHQGVGRGHCQLQHMLCGKTSPGWIVGIAEHQNSRATLQGSVRKRYLAPNDATITTRAAVFATNPDEFDVRTYSHSGRLAGLGPVRRRVVGAAGNGAHS